MIVCAGRTEVFDFATTIGVGLIESAINLTRLVLEQNPSEIVFIGSCGSFGGLEPLEIITSCEAANVEHSALSESAYSPLELQEKSKNIQSDLDSNVIINSSNYITTSQDMAKKLATHGMDAENMEFYSVLRTAREFGVHAYGVFVVTNYCDENAHADYLKNLPQAKKILEDYCKKELKI